MPFYRLRRFARPVAALSLAAGLVALAGEARAQGGTLPEPAKTPEPATTPPAPPGDGANAGRILGEVEARAKKDKLEKVVEEPLRHARKALERANGARASGDTAHARMLDGLAFEWAETARDLIRAAAAERDAVATAKKARELGVQVERARALLEETQARRGRAAADLEKAEAEAKEAAKRAAAAEAERVEKRPKDPKQPAKGGAAGPKKGAAGAPKGKK